MKLSIKRLLFEAFRRLDIADAHERSKPMRDRWIGLGTASEYRPALEAGLMRWHDGKKPPPRCMGWLCLTPPGLDALEQCRDEFTKQLSDLKQNYDYQRSLVSQYQLARW